MLTRGVGGSKKPKDVLTLYMNGPLDTLHMIENAKDLDISADISTKDNELG